MSELKNFYINTAAKAEIIKNFLADFGPDLASYVESYQQTSSNGLTSLLQGAIDSDFPSDAAVFQLLETWTEFCNSFGATLVTYVPENVVGPTNEAKGDFEARLLEFKDTYESFYDPISEASKNLRISLFFDHFI